MHNPHTDAVLFVDDDAHLLDSIRRQYRKVFDLQTAQGGPEGLEVLRDQGPFAVVVSDFQMPGMNGIEFLREVRQQAPDTVRIMLTGNADLQSAIAAVNDGHVFRFLTKPCSREALAEGIRAGLDLFRLRQAERHLLEGTLQGAIEVLVDVLSLANPFAFGRATRVRSYVKQMAAHMSLEQSWQYEAAALLSQIGCVAIPSALIERVAQGVELSPEQTEMFDKHPEVARELLFKIPRLEHVAEMIALQRRNPLPAGLQPEVRLGTQMLAAALELDELVSVGATAQQAIESLNKNARGWESAVLDALAHVTLPTQNMVAKFLTVSQLRVGMIADADIVNRGGMVLVAKGFHINRGTLMRLLNHAQLGGIVEPLRVLVPQTREAPPENAAA